MDASRVDQMIRANRSFDEIEQAIERSALTADARSALWLYAWVETDRPERQRITNAIIAALEGEPESRLMRAG